MRVLFLHHQQRRSFREEPGYNELFLPLLESPRLTDWREFVYQPILREFYRYERQLIPPTQLSDVELFNAILRANQAFYPTLEAMVEISAPDLIVYSPSFFYESISPLLFPLIKAKFPGVKLFTQLWDYDENSAPLVWFEREIIKVSDVVAIADNHARLERIRRREGPYASFENTDAAVWLPTRPNPRVFHKRDLPQEIDVCVLGSSEGLRKTVIDDLTGRYGERFHHAGGYMAGDTFLPFGAYADFIWRSRIVVNTQTRPERQQIKGRAREILACGGFLLDQLNDETARFFADSGVVLWRDLDDLHAKIDYYLAHDDERRTIAAATNAWYRQHYPAATYFDEILAHLERRSEASTAATG